MEGGMDVFRHKYSGSALMEEDQGKERSVDGGIYGQSEGRRTGWRDALKEGCLDRKLQRQRNESVDGGMFNGGMY